MGGVLDQSTSRHAWRAPVVVGSAAAGLALAAGQAAVGAALAKPRLDRWGEDLVHLTPSMVLGDLVVFVPVLVCLVLYPLLTMLAGLVGARRGDVGWPTRRAQGAALVPWLFAGPLYLTLDVGPAGGDGWAVVLVCWLVALGCLLYMLRVLARPPRETAHWTAGPQPSRYDRQSWM